jgi:ABC-type antimicrobial peptide transport system permease subunit
LREQRLVAGLTSIFGLVALALACVGLFGAMSYAVSRRTTEFGVRMALGARRSHVLRSVLGESLKVVAYGLAAGVPAALVASAWLSSLLFGVSPNDPLTIVTASLLLAAVAAAAGVLPAWRAARTDPIVALRAE